VFPFTSWEGQLCRRARERTFDKNRARIFTLKLILSSTQQITPVNKICWWSILLCTILHLASARPPIITGGFRLAFGQNLLSVLQRDMDKARSLRIIILTLAVAGSLAWVGRHPPSSGTAPNPNSALQYQNGDDYQPVESSTNNVISDELGTKLRLQLALQAARDADRLFGLCTPASTQAWKTVDDIYSSSSASREVEINVKRVLGEEKSIWRVFQQ
jgi:hypothetical protein